jgi:transposase
VARTSRYSREFMEEAVRLTHEPGQNTVTVGRDLGLSHTTIRNWKVRLEAESDPVVRRAREEHAELIALRRRVKILEEEREILSKAAAFRAREIEGRQ